MKSIVMTGVAAAVLMFVGCSNKTSESNFETVCVAQMMKGSSDNMDKKKAEKMMQGICGCAAPTFGKMSETSKTEFIDLVESGKDGQLSNKQDEKALTQALANCTMQAVGKMMQEAGKQH